ncbi:hypothetical protein ADIARSV_3503 [Arcticibacter svalbardensis MN12-7]|uniref:HEAT repeat domain-containing protein n=1 Tax=Arcticibacter svalbardensis MN12-7 TaxID=1150600 RepID=R9GWT4_9SPHI|nr:hypothetical protein [Arcticibacter svalbardensis]EOR93424.1 hypothetical protein ADIARSV_3503 [Arcticibacter svalbardensis MN12-7]
MDDYKTELLKQIENTKKQRASAIADFLNINKSDKERLTAFENFGTFNEEEDVQKAQLILRDDKQNGKIRAAALEGLVNEVGVNEKLMDEVISILNNEKPPIPLRSAALSVLQTTSFGSIVFPSKRPAYFNVLRKVVVEDNDLRAPAMEYLAMNNDAFIQKKLIDGLNEPKAAITKPEIAIQLLAYDLHAEHYPVLRKIATNPPNLQSKKEALRNLAADPDSKDLLWRTMQNTKEDPETRHACAVALENLNPGDIQVYAKKMILDPNENEELKAAMLNTLTFSMDAGALNDVDFKKKLDNVQKRVSSPGLRKMVADFKSSAEQRRAK